MKFVPDNNYLLVKIDEVEDKTVTKSGLIVTDSNDDDFVLTGKVLKSGGDTEKNHEEETVAFKKFHGEKVFVNYDRSDEEEYMVVKEEDLLGCYVDGD